MKSGRKAKKKSVSFGFRRLSNTPRIAMRTALVWRGLSDEAANPRWRHMLHAR